MTTYNENVPNPAHFPYQDVNAMFQNTNSIKVWSGIDHVVYGAATAGQHQQVTFPQPISQSSQTGTASVAYTDVTPNTLTYASLMFRNSNGISQVTASPQTFTSTYSVSSGSATFSPTTFTLNYYVGGGVTFFFYTGSVTISGSSGNGIVITLPSTSLIGGACFSGGSFYTNGFSLISSASSSVITGTTASNGTQTFKVSGYYL